MALPPALERLRGRLKGSVDGDRQMVKILTAVMVDGLDAVDAAAAEALAQGMTSADVVLNILARARSAPVGPGIAMPEHLAEAGVSFALPGSNRMAAMPKFPETLCGSRSPAR